ncbi:MAG: RecQ family ATP-dependent DNA helicase [Oscillochloridaceae bacterium umkhey_bin13]
MPIPELNPLLSLPPPALALVSGDLRKRLVAYLSRWGHQDALLAYLDHWLQAQPGSVGLREGRARVLTELGRGAEALTLLDRLDAERPPSQSRRTLRIRALLAARRQPELDRALAALAADELPPVALALVQGEVLRARGQLEAASEILLAAAEVDPLAVAPVRALAELALELADPEAARGQIEALMLRPGYHPTVADLQILWRAATLAEDHASATDLAAQLAKAEADERAALAQHLGLVPEPGLAEPVAEAVAETSLLPEEAYHALRDLFGMDEFRPHQVRVIARVLAGEPTLAVMPTGAGKSLTYQLPALLLPQPTVVVSPLIALMKDQLDGLPDQVRPYATLINSSLSTTELSSRLRGLARGDFRLVYIAPERLRQRAFLHALKRAGVARFVIDEVHCLSLWGTSFRPDYLFIGRALTELGNPPVLALTATASRETQAELQAELGPWSTINASVFRPNLFLQVVRAANHTAKLQVIQSLCAQIDGPIIVYARSRQSCETIAEALRAEGVAAEHYHAQVLDRAATQERFMAGLTRVLVATVAFGMGIDKPDIRAIIHYNLPQSLEAYYQEAGRAGRDGRPARCVLLYASHDQTRLLGWLEEEALTRADLRALYRAVRSALGGTLGLLDLAQLQPALPGDNESLVRVGLSMLERVGLLRRHFDAPERVNLSLTGAAPPDPQAERLAQVLGASPGVATDYDLLDLAAQAELNPIELEAHLLAWHDAGFLRMRGIQRLPMIELLAAPPDVANRIDQLLHTYQQRQTQRIEAMAAYARSASCRHRSLAAHFGQRLTPCRNACDLCAPRS